MKYGIIMYVHTDNIGDDIQTYATLKYLPRVDFIIDREKLNKVEFDIKVKAILNGWYLYNNLNWPPAKNLDVLPISIHITNDYFQNRFEKKLFDYRTKKYFKNFDKIGCRDKATSSYLNELGIKNYISNCLTLTLDKFDIEKPKEEYICCVDVNKEVLLKTKKTTTKKVIEMTHDYRGKNLDNMYFEERMKQVEDLLKIYQNASCVITSRYHVAMPCIALGTPVLLIPSKFEPCRYDGLNEIINVIKLDDFLYNKCDFDINHPPKNKDITYIKNDLENKCKNFIQDKNNNEIQYKEEEIEDSFCELITKYNTLEKELNNRRRVSYYNNMDYDEVSEKF